VPLATALSSLGCLVSDSVITNDCRVCVLFRWNESFDDEEGEVQHAIDWVSASDAAAFVLDFNSVHNGLPHGVGSRFDGECS